MEFGGVLVGATRQGALVGRMVSTYPFRRAESHGTRVETSTFSKAEARIIAKRHLVGSRPLKYVANVGGVRLDAQSEQSKQMTFFKCSSHCRS